MQEQESDFCTQFETSKSKSQTTHTKEKQELEEELYEIEKI